MRRYRTTHTQLLYISIFRGEGHHLSVVYTKFGVHRIEMIELLEASRTTYIQQRIRKKEEESVCAPGSSIGHVKLLG